MTDNTNNKSTHEDVELRIDAKTAAFIKQLAADADVTESQAASVLTVLAMRSYIAMHGLGDTIKPAVRPDEPTLTSPAEAREMPDEYQSN